MFECLFGLLVTDGCVCYFHIVCLICSFLANIYEDEFI